MRQQVKTPIDALHEVRRLLETVGWCQGANFRDGIGEVIPSHEVCNHGVKPAAMCMNGAFLLCSGDHEIICIAELAVRRAVNGDMQSWNDAPHRLFSEVLAKLEEAESFAQEMWDHFKEKCRA